MVGLLSPDRYDLAVLLSTIGLLLIGYVIYPTHLVRTSAWFTIFTIYVCYTGFLAYKLTFDTEV
ncbi:hypothetical protein [Halobacteriaceae bacterium SHR40]|uniref:hypothetical protein n=1 Tax=Halovenus amylolytica TaxID=2500550 RepID=UPI000FE3419A